MDPITPVPAEHNFFASHCETLDSQASVVLSDQCDQGSGLETDLVFAPSPHKGLQLAVAADDAG